LATDSALLRCPSCRTLNRVPEEKLKSHPNCGKCATPLTFPDKPVSVTTASFDQEVRDWPELLLVEFWAKWCGYSHKAEPLVNDLAAWRAGKLKVITVDIDEEPVLAQRFTIKATPTFILYRSSRQLARMNSAPKEKLELIQWVDRFLKE
jgi:thioredoxin 2